MGRFCVNCVMSNWLTITLLELCVIIFNTGMYALAWRLAKAKCQSCHTLQPAAAVRDPICAVYSSKRRPTSVVVQDFQALFENVCLLVVISLRACDFSSCRALFFFQVQNRRKSLTSYAISRSYRRRYISRYMRSLSVNYGSVY